MNTRLSQIGLARPAVTLGGIASGIYEARQYPLASPPSGPGIYAIVDSGTLLTRSRVLYIGIAEDVATRVVPSHEKMAQAKQLGATHVLVVTCANALARPRIEARLIAHYNPPLNRKGLRRLGSSLRG